MLGKCQRNKLEQTPEKLNDEGWFTLMYMTGISPTLTQEPIMQMVHLEKVLGGSSSALTARQSLGAS